MQSNNWVIHGNHTKSGKPLISSDPHLGTSLPANWELMNLNAPDFKASGCTYPGLPLVAIGRVNKVAWAATAVLSDVSDVYKEQIDIKNKKYLVDGVWKDLKVTN